MSCWWYINLVIKSCYLDTMGRIRVACEALERKILKGERGVAPSSLKNGFPGDIFYFFSF